MMKKKKEKWISTELRYNFLLICKNLIYSIILKFLQFFIDWFRYRKFDFSTAGDEKIQYVNAFKIVYGIVIKKKKKMEG